MSSAAERKAAGPPAHLRNPVFDEEYGVWREGPASSTYNPQPTGDGTVILGLVTADLIGRAAEGRRKYGTMLRSDNGRDALADAYQEALDLCMYLRQALYERDRA